MDYGKIDEWGSVCDEMDCDDCGNVTEWGNDSKCLDLCTSCYIEKVVIPNTEPIESVSDELIGREVVRVKDSVPGATVGCKYKIFTIADDYIVFYDDNRIPSMALAPGYFRLLTSRAVKEKSEAEYYENWRELEPLEKWDPNWGFNSRVRKLVCVEDAGASGDLERGNIYECYCANDIYFVINNMNQWDIDRFAALPESSNSEKPNNCPGDKREPPKPQYEYTHSAVLEDCHGNQIEIPGPDPEYGWESKEVFKNFWQRQHVHSILDGKYTKHITTGHLSWKITHKEALMMAQEYEPWVRKEHPIFISITKWTRIKPAISKTETTVTD